MKTKLLRRIYYKLRNWSFRIGQMETTCPICGEIAPIEDLSDCEAEDHFMCCECSITCEDAVLCKNHYPWPEIADRSGVDPANDPACSHKTVAEAKSGGASSANDGK